MLAKSFQGSFRSRTILATTPKFATVPACTCQLPVQVLQCLVLVGSQQMISGLGGKHPSCVLSLVRIRTGSDVYVDNMFRLEPQPDPPSSRGENHLSTKTPAKGRVWRKKIK